MISDVSSATIETEVLRYDRRRIGRLRSAIPADFCDHAARRLMGLRDVDGPVLVATGFFIAHAAKPETDGPPGTIALAIGLERLGLRVELADAPGSEARYQVAGKVGLKRRDPTG